MAKETTGVVDAPTTQEAGSGVASDGNLSFGELSGMFAQSGVAVESEAMSEEGEGESTEQVTDDAPETEGDSQAEDTSEDTEDDSEDSDDDDVLSELSPNGAKRARKRINKLTARAKEAEEKLAERDKEMSELQQRIEALEKSPKEDAEQTAQEITFSDRIHRAESIKDLQSLRDIARQTKEFCRENWDEHEVELGVDERGEPRIIDHKELARMLNEAERVLEQDIPRRANYLKKRAEVQSNTVRDFPAWQDKDHPDHQRLLSLWNDPVAKQTFHRMPNGQYLVSVLNEGLKAIEARSKQDAPEGKQVQTEAAPAPKKEQRVAPRVPGVDATSAPVANSDSTDFEKRFQGKTSLSTDDMVAYFAAQERARQNRKS